MNGSNVFRKPENGRTRLDQGNLPILSPKLADGTKTDQSSLLSRLIVIWVTGTILFLPIKIVNLPSNFELVDIWNIMGMPILLVVYGMGRGQRINLTYMIPMWLVMTSSLLSTFASPSISNSLIVVLKEIYLFTWFMAVTVFLSVLNARELRFVLHVWAWVVVLHGLLIIAQFLSPELWRLTNSLGGNSARLVDYRASGLFICDAAGCANKAAYFQLVGFVPLLLSGFSKQRTGIFGVLLLVSILTTGSMGSTLSFFVGLIASIFTIALFKKAFSVVIKYFLQFVLAVSLLGGALSIAITQNPAYLDHFQKIIVGRFDKSSSGRFDLWQRGLTVLLEHRAYLWGVGPENFRVVDPAQTDNQLHNDFLAFMVERGLIGVLGLVLFPIIALRRTFSLLQSSKKASGQVQFELVVFVGIVMATMFESLTHQLFRTRELWLILALQEAVYFAITTSKIETLTDPHMQQLARRYPLAARKMTQALIGKK